MILAGLPSIPVYCTPPTAHLIRILFDDALKIMGEQAVKMLGGNGKVAIITSFGATNLQLRLDGVKDVLAKSPGMQIVEVYDIKEDALRCGEIISTGTRRNPRNPRLCLIRRRALHSIRNSAWLRPAEPPTTRRWRQSCTGTACR